MVFQVQVRQNDRVQVRVRSPGVLQLTFMVGGGPKKIKGGAS